ncbi:hypochlorite stress DNA-binding transcriptional regulator HypT [Escherichia coli]|uniref:hypochlorite stress DNA-binding transcriptional regulator HypT n=1 Tax=Escherichia coli TaxID=562 RepID=UPI001BFC6336|nr:hypochlorite stress DNA-binding transcriptional regulator HypT [Escherichia coli]
MDDCGAVLHNIETKWLYDFLTLEKCRNFSQAAVSRNVSQPAFSRRIRALEQAIGVELFNRQMPPLFTWAIEAIDVDEAVDKLREGQSDCIFSFHDEDLLEAPFDHIRLFESQLFPVCASDEHGEALFNLAQPHFPLLNYSRNSYMGRLINRTLTRHSELSFSTFFVSSMSELLKQVALDGCGIAWLPEYAIQQEIRSGQLVVLNRDELVIPIQAYAYRMNTRMNPVAERFWRELRELEIVLS